MPAPEASFALDTAASSRRGAERRLGASAERTVHWRALPGTAAGSRPSRDPRRLTRTGPHNARGDTIAIRLRDPDEIRLEIEPAGSEAPDPARPWPRSADRCRMSDRQVAR